MSDLLDPKTFFDGASRVRPVPGNVKFRDMGDSTFAEVVSTIVQSSGYVAQALHTRPADTAAYTAGDVVGATSAAIEFASIGPANGHIIITDIDLRLDIASVPTGMTTFRLHLYDATPPSALADNAVWDLPAGDRASYLGFVDFDAPVDVGSTLFIQMLAVNKKVKMGSTANLFGYLVTTTGFTPSSATVNAIRLNAVGV